MTIYDDNATSYNITNNNNENIYDFYAVPQSKKNNNSFTRENINHEENKINHFNPDNWMLSNNATKRANQVAKERYEQIQNQNKKDEEKHIGRQDALDKHKKRLDFWEFDEKRNRRNIRTLLTKLQDVLCDGIKWKPVTLSEVLSEKSCKKYYKEAVKLTHPDMTSRRNANVEDSAICERIFQALNVAFYDEFGN